MNNPFAKFWDTGTWATLGLNIVAGAALLAASAWFSYNLLSTRQSELAPRIVNSIALEPTILLAGKPFKAHINVTLNRLCPYEVHWSFVRKSDGLEVAKIVEPVKQPPAELGTQDLPDAVRYVPIEVGPGYYQYVSEVFDLCADGHTYTSVRRNVDITIR